MNSRHRLDPLEDSLVGKPMDELKGRICRLRIRKAKGEVGEARHGRRNVDTPDR